MRKKISTVFILILLFTINIYASADLMMGSRSIWFALFGLSVVGVLALYFYSGQVEAVSSEYLSAKDKQNVALSILNERLKNSSIGIHRHREFIEELAMENPDLQILKQEAKKIKRDEKLLEDAIRDLEFFAAIQSDRLKIENFEFDMEEMLGALKKEITPYLLPKSTIFKCIMDPDMPKHIYGDRPKALIILETIIADIVSDMYGEEIVLNVTKYGIGDGVLFEIKSNDTKVDMSNFGDVPNADEFDGSEHSIRILKNYIADQFINKLGGEIEFDDDKKRCSSCKITLPLKFSEKD